MASSDLDKVPSLYEHCVTVYDAMFEKAELTEVQAEEILVYEGFLTKLITRDLHLSVPYYSSTTKRLKAMDCIRQLRRGGSSTPSRWALLQSPTLEAFNRTLNKGSTRPTSTSQQISDLSKRISALEGSILEGVEDGNH